MRVTGTVGEDNQIILPEDVVRALRLSPGTAIEVDIRPPAMRESSEDKRRRSAHLDAVLDEFQGSMRQDMLDQGYASVDEMMNDIRPPW